MGVTGAAQSLPGHPQLAGNPWKNMEKRKGDRSPDTSLSSLLPRVLYDVSRYTNTQTSLEKVGGLAQEVGGRAKKG